jgi:hypothetical protein
VIFPRKMLSKLIDSIVNASPALQDDVRLYFSIAIAGLCAAIVFRLLYNQRIRYACLPPGPTGLPILGHLLAMGKSRHDPDFKWVANRIYLSLVNG